MKARAYLEQARNSAADSNATRGRLGDAREDLQEGRLARAVAPDDADYFALGYLEGNVFQGPEGLRFQISDFRFLIAETTKGDCICQHVSKRPMAIRLMADDVFLAEVFDSDHGVRHRKMTDDGRPTTDRRPSEVSSPQRQVSYLPFILRLQAGHSDHDDLIYRLTDRHILAYFEYARHRKFPA